MKNKLLNQKDILLLTIYLSFTIEIASSCSLIPSNNIIQIFKMTIIFIALFFCMIHICMKNKAQRKFLKELHSGEFLVAYFFILSMYYSLKNHNFNIKSIIGLYQIFFPFLITFLVINELDKKGIFNFMRFSLCIIIIGFIYLEINKFKDITSIFKISFINSYSPFENWQLAEVSNGIACFFIYFKKKMPYCCIISLILNFLIFKRMLLLMLFVLFILSYIKDIKLHILDKKTNIFIFVFFNIIIFIYYAMLQPNNSALLKQKYSFDISSFSMGRSIRYWYLKEQHFQSSGLESTSSFLVNSNLKYIGMNMEMDFIRFIVELGILSIPVFLAVYIYITKGDFYSTVMISFCFFNLLFANGIENYWGYSFRIITIGMINYQYNSVFYQKKLRKIFIPKLKLRFII